MSNFELSYQAHKALCHHIDKANQYFGQTFPVPSINFKLKGKTAGKAYLHKWEIRLNPVLFSENKQQFLQEVIPHELAHLLTFKKFVQVKPHGIEWKSIMEQVFSIPAKTTHNFTVTSVQGKTFEYQCPCNNYPLTIRRHNKVLRGHARYSCKKCNQELIYTGVQLS